VSHRRRSKVQLLFHVKYPAVSFAVSRNTHSYALGQSFSNLLGSTCGSSNSNRRPVAADVAPIPKAHPTCPAVLQSLLLMLIFFAVVIVAVYLPRHEQ
jgi:hypothetical protein